MLEWFKGGLLPELEAGLQNANDINNIFENAIETERCL